MCIIKQTPEVDAFSKFISVTTALLVVIIVMFYAGLRYHNDYDYQTLYYQHDLDNHSYIPFPAVTICPLAPNLPPLTNPRLFWGQFTDYSTFNDSVTTIMTTTVKYRGQMVNCIQFNNDADMFEEARGTHYGLIIRFSQDISAVTNTWSQVGPYPLTGAIGILHVRQTTPVINDTFTFYAPLGQTAEVSVWNYYRRTFKGPDVEQFYKAVPSLVSNHAYDNTSQIVLAYNQYGAYVLQPFYVYRAWNWIGEVGGAAALLFFLQHGLLWASIGCARRTCYRDAHRERKRREVEDARLREAARNDAVAEVAAQQAVAEAPAPAPTPVTGARKNRRAQADNNSVEMKPQRQPRADGRVAIDMDSLAEDSE